MKVGEHEPIETLLGHAQDNGWMDSKRVVHHLPSHALVNALACPGRLWAVAMASGHLPARPSCCPGHREAVREHRAKRRAANCPYEDNNGDKIEHLARNAHARALSSMITR